MPTQTPRFRGTRGLKFTRNEMSMIREAEESLGLRAPSLGIRQAWNGNTHTFAWVLVIGALVWVLLSVRSESASNRVQASSTPTVTAQASSNIADGSSRQPNTAPLVSDTPTVIFANNSGSDVPVFDSITSARLQIASLRSTQTYSYRDTLVICNATASETWKQVTIFDERNSNSPIAGYICGELPGSLGQTPDLQRSASQSGQQVGIAAANSIFAPASGSLCQQGVSPASTAPLPLPVLPSGEAYSVADLRRSARQHEGFEFTDIEAMLDAVWKPGEVLDFQQLVRNHQWVEAVADEEVVVLSEPRFDANVIQRIPRLGRYDSLDTFLPCSSDGTWNVVWLPEAKESEGVSCIPVISNGWNK